ncbi:MAG: hypothetical protein LBS15_02785 [Endomicrobium sp.]|jgi:hypothetical protein|nr:hypothetical protein [Endomicrobium sp.]
MEKGIKIFTVLVVSFVSMLLQTVGAFYSKSFVLFSHANLIIINTLSSFLKFICSNEIDEIDESLQRAQIVSIILNSMTLFILALVVTNKASISMDVHTQSSKIISVNVSEITTTIVFIGFVFCSFIDRQFILTALLSFLIILGFSVHIFERIVSLDYYLSAFFTVLVTIQTILLIKKSVGMLKNKKRCSVLLSKKL